MYCYPSSCLLYSGQKVHSMSTDNIVRLWGMQTYLCFSFFAGRNHFLLWNVSPLVHSLGSDVVVNPQVSHDQLIIILPVQQCGLVSSTVKHVTVIPYNHHFYYQFGQVSDLVTYGRHWILRFENHRISYNIQDYSTAMFDSIQTDLKWDAGQNSSSIGWVWCFMEHVNYTSLQVS